MRTTALIVAAGSGRRLGAAHPKAFMHLAGKPMLEYSLAAFQDHPEVDAIVLVVPPGRTEEGARLADRFGKIHAVTAGGARRRDSVLRGLERLDPESPDDLVLIHDAARPLVDAEIITAVRRAAARDGAAVPGIRPHDTVRRIRTADDSGDTLAVERIDREALVLVQTPQGFRVGILREAYARAGDADVTDDASLVEGLGGRITVVPGAPRNLKITTADDLRAAEAWLS